MSTIGSDTPSTSRDLVLAEDGQPDCQSEPRRKVLEEDEYLGRMSKIIKRDFFAEPDFDGLDEATPSTRGPQTTVSRICDSPGTGRTGISTTSSVNSRRQACSMRLNEFLSKYTSEDNDYFDRLQAKELKRHRLRFPWLYKDHNKKNSSLTAPKSDVKMIDCPRNTPSTSVVSLTEDRSHRPNSSTVNYESSKYMREPLFKDPLPVSDRPRTVTNRFTDKIGIDGKLLNGSETPSMNGYSYVPAPETPKLPETVRIKQENRFFLPGESPRDALAHRLYEDKIARKIRTPASSTRSDSTKTPINKLDRIF